MALLCWVSSFFLLFRPNYTQHVIPHYVCLVSVIGIFHVQRVICLPILLLCCSQHHSLFFHSPPAFFPSIFSPFHAHYPSQVHPRQMSVAKVGAVAPLIDVKLDAVLANDEISQITIKDYLDQGKYVVLYFYPLAFTYVSHFSHLLPTSTEQQKLFLRYLFFPHRVCPPFHLFFLIYPISSSHSTTHTHSQPFAMSLKPHHNHYIHKQHFVFFSNRLCFQSSNTTCSLSQ